MSPSVEPAWLCRKPLSGTVAANVIEYGTGAINVDGCRIGTADMSAQWDRAWAPNSGPMGARYPQSGRERGKEVPPGRWPANLILGCACDGEHDPGCAVAMLDAQSGELAGQATYRRATAGEDAFAGATYGTGKTRPVIQPGFGDTGGASRYFKIARASEGERWCYCAKASRAEREAGLASRIARKVNDGRDTSMDTPYQRGDTQRLNTHPTVKPIDLTRWLVRLVTPPGGLVLDPFAGSGSTGCAAALEGFRFLGFELDPEYAEIARARIEHWTAVAAEETAQASLFDEEPEPSPLRPWVQGGLDL